MQYFYLLLLLPPEIVNIIYNINLKDKAISSIIQFYKTRYQYNSHMKYILRYTLFMGQDISYVYIRSLQFILKNFYNLPKTYNNCFFKNLLALLSYKLMAIQDYILFRDIDHYSLKSCLKNCINSWFKLCVKINCKISFYTMNHKSNKNENYRNYANKFKINTFNKILYAPTILEYHGLFHIFKDEAHIFLRDKLYEIENNM